MKRFFMLGIASLILCTGCSSSRQVEGTFTGAWLGGVFGSAVGGLTGGWRGSDAGTAIGMIVGGAVGAAVTAPQTQRQDYDEGGYSDYEASGSRRYSRKGDRSKDKSPGQSEYALQQSQIEGLTLEDIRFVDENHDFSLQPLERGKIVFNIYNRGKQTLYNVTPVVSVNKKQIAVSPSAIISILRPGKGCVYTASVYSNARLKTGEALFSIAFQDGSRMVTYKTFAISTKKK